MYKINIKSDKSIFLLFLFYILLSLTKGIMAVFFMKTPSVMPDELTLAEIARSFVLSHKIGFYFGRPVGKEPLYSMLISPAFLFHNMFYSYNFIKLLNGFYSSIIIFPLFFLGRELLDNKSALLIAIVAGLLPASNSYSLNILAENIYFPCFLISIYFLYKYEIDRKLSFAILSGIFTGCTFLAKPTGIALFAGYAVYVLFASASVSGQAVFNRIKGIVNAFKERKIIFILSGMLILIWLVRNGYYFGFSVPGMLHYHYGEANNFISMRLPYLYLAYLILEHISLMFISSGLIPFLFSLYLIWLVLRNDFTIIDENDKAVLAKVKTLLGIIIPPFILLLIIASKQSELMKYAAHTNRLLGRHIVAIMPLIFLVGAAGFNLFNKYKNLKSLKIITILLSAAIFFIAVFSVNKYITDQAIIGSPGDLFMYIFKASDVPVIGELHAILLPPLFLKTLIILLLLGFAFFQFKYRLTLKFYFIFLISFLLVANTYAMAGNIGLGKWTIGISKIPRYLAKHKISERNIVVSNSIVKNNGFMLQMQFWLGNNFKYADIFPEQIKIAMEQFKNGQFKTFLPNGRYEIFCVKNNTNVIKLSLNNRIYSCRQNKPIIFTQDKIGLRLAVNKYNNFKYLTIKNLDKKYFNKPIFYVSDHRDFNGIKRFSNLYLINTGKRPYFYY